MKIRGKIYTLTTEYGKEKVYIDVEHYVDGDGIALSLISKKALEPYADITVNIDSDLGDNKSYVFLDTNNCPWAEKFMKENGLGMPTGEYGASGFCLYPKYKLNTHKLNEEKLVVDN